MRLSLLAVTGSLLMALVPASGAVAAPSQVPAGRRVLVISVPGLRWSDVDRPELAALRALLDEGAVANLATRVTGTVSKPGEAYLTLGSGTRATDPTGITGSSFGAGESIGVGTAGEEYARQAGRPLAASAVAVLGWPSLERENASGEFDPTLGTLGQALVDAGIQRGVVGNADVLDPMLGGQMVRGRQVVAALADHTGSVPCGAVDAGLLEADPSAAFGVGLDVVAVVAAVRRCAVESSVVLVEASDLRRATAFADRAEAGQAEQVRATALARTDALVSALLKEVDPRRDAVVVFSPTVAPAPGLGLLGLRAAGVRPGLLTSGSTRRDGYVVLADLTPTIASLVGAPLDEGRLEGRVVAVSADRRTPEARRDGLVDGESAALFRDRMLQPVTLVYVAAVALLALAAAGAFVWRWRRVEPWLEQLALVLIAFPACTYLAALLPFDRWGAGPYWIVTIAASALLGAAARLLRRRWLAPVAFAYALVAAVVVVSVVALDSALQMSTVFGDSPIVAGRFSGINNVTFAFFLGAVAWLAALVVHTVPGHRGRRWMVTVLVAALAVDVAPMWGADVGGVLAGVPALALLGTGLGRWKVRWRTVLLVAAATVALVVLLGLLDLTRAPADRTHLGRLFERIGSEGLPGLTTVVNRKLGANLRSLTGSTWRFMLVPVGLAAVLIARRARERASAVVGALPPVAWAAPGVAAIALLGYAANDSGIAVPGALAGSVVPGLVYLACRLGPERTGARS